MPDQPPVAPLSPHELAETLVTDVVCILTELVEHHAPELEPPNLLAGHHVDDAARSDLIYTLGLLDRAGVKEICGLPTATKAVDLIHRLDPAAVEAFASYRVGETLLHLGGRALLADWPEPTRSAALACVDTRGTVAAVREGTMPPNYAVVVARCLAAERSLTGRIPEPWDEFFARAAELFDTTTGWIDDGPGTLRHFDIYSPDMYLFAEPLADELGQPWSEGLERLSADLDDLVLPGGAVVWGRSIGALGLAMTIELGGQAARGRLHGEPARWVERADEARRSLVDEWFDDGLINAHRHRATMFYRGPPRRLQMTLDILGKLLLAAIAFRAGPAETLEATGSPWPTADRLIRCDPDDTASVWAVRTPRLSFSLPVMFGWASDYLPTPRGPGWSEVPTSGHPCLLPVLHHRGKELVPAGPAASAEHHPGQLMIEHEGWAPVGQDGEGPDAVEGGRRATYRIDGRSLEVTEELTIADPSEADDISLTIAEATGRPLDVEVATLDAGGRRSPLPVRAVTTEGIAEWRSFWSELGRVHQAEVPATASFRLSWRVTPQLRVADTIAGHDYSDELYRPIGDRLVRQLAPPPGPGLTHRLRAFDVFHLAWPEWWTGTDPTWTAQTIDSVRRADVAIVWTQHNLAPHADKGEEARACYELWAEAADLVIHHSDHGRDVALDTYRYGDTTRHAVVAHGHWGERHARQPAVDREHVEAENGWPPCAIRLGVVGAPRGEKDVQSVLDAVAATERDDLQLVVRVGPDDAVPDDPRIVAERIMIDEGLYVRRLAGIDALVLPFAPTGMLTTGTAFDAIGAGLAAITSDWGFFDETFAGADIRYGWGADDLATCLDQLTPEMLNESAAAVAGLQSRFDWGPIAERTLGLIADAATPGR